MSDHLSFFGTLFLSDHGLFTISNYDLRNSRAAREVAEMVDRVMSHCHRENGRVGPRRIDSAPPHRRLLRRHLTTPPPLGQTRALLANLPSSRRPFSPFGQKLHFCLIPLRALGSFHRLLNRQWFVGLPILLRSSKKQRFGYDRGFSARFHFRRA